MTQRITSLLSRWLVAATLAFFCLRISPAQEPAGHGTVSGVVKDSTGATITGAHVSLTTPTAAET